jgi:hypothetical protein
MWAPNVVSRPAEKRAIAVALVNGLGNSASYAHAFTLDRLRLYLLGEKRIYGSFLWPTTTAPRYVQGFATTTYVMLVSCGLLLFRTHFDDVANRAFVALLAIFAQVMKYLVKRYPYPEDRELEPTTVKDGPKQLED